MFFFLLPLLLHLHPFPTASAASASRCALATGNKLYEKCTTLPTQEASLAWTYHPKNATLEVAFSASFISPSGWVAWGLNPDSPQMTGTRALIAFSDPTSGALVVLPYLLVASVKLQTSPLASRPFDIPLLSSSAFLSSGPSVRDGANVQIHATFKLHPNHTRIHHVWNRGLYVQGYSPTIHPTTVADLSSRQTLDLLSSTSATTGPGVSADALRSAHAILNALSWGFCLPVGVVVARYLRQYPSAGPSWFYAHALVQVPGFLMGSAGFAIGLAMGNASEGIVYGLHRALGVAAFCMGALQAAALMFRPGATHRFRKYWKSYHHLVGYGCVVVGVVNVFQGFEVMGLGESYAKLAYCLALSTTVGVCVALEANAWVVFCRKAEEDKVRGERVGDQAAGSSSTETKRQFSGSF